MNLVRNVKGIESTQNSLTWDRIRCVGQNVLRIGQNEDWKQKKTQGEAKLIYHIGKQPQHIAINAGSTTHAVFYVAVGLCFILSVGFVQ